MRYQLWRNGQAVDLSHEKKLGEGGEARVFAIATMGLAAKLYHRPTPERADKLRVMLEHPPVDPASATGHVAIAWPSDLLLHENGSFHGYVMPLVARMHPLVSFYVPKLRRLERPLFDYFYLVTAALNVATAVHALHERNYVIGDVNESNILLAETALATVVGTDSFQVCDPAKGRVFRCRVGKPEFTPPELHGKDFALLERTRQHDCFGLGVLLFQLLMEGTHPFDGVYPKGSEPLELENRIAAGHFPHGHVRRCPMKPKPIAPPFEILDPALQHLFLQCFVDGHARPTERPDAGTWRSALAQSAHTLRRCLVNPQHRYWGHIACPWCERTSRLGGMDPFPSVQAVKKRQHLVQQSTGARTPISMPPRRLPVMATPIVRPRAATFGTPVRVPVRARPTVQARPKASGFKLQNWWWLAWLVFMIMKALFSSSEPPHYTSTPTLPSVSSRPWLSTPRASALPFPKPLMASLDQAEEGKSFHNSTGARMVWIPPGNFRMGDLKGDGEANEKPVHDVRLTAGYWLGETTVTQAQWQGFMGKNSSYFKGDNMPVVDVSWNDAVAFCALLTAQEHLAGRLPSRIEYRLPTEAQWEYACRVGTTGDFAGGPEVMAWFDTNSEARPHEVAKKVPNPWGLYDMHGNVSQWCADWYASYRPAADIDPTGPWDGTQRVARGGSWAHGSKACRSATRFAISPDSESSRVGFRLAAVAFRTVVPSAFNLSPGVPNVDRNTGNFLPPPHLSPR